MPGLTMLDDDCYRRAASDCDEKQKSRPSLLLKAAVSLLALAVMLCLTKA